MKKRFCALVLALGAALGVFGQNSGPIDLILLLDTSVGMSDSYQEVNNYITGGFLREFLRTGDTFHLIPFSDKPRLDICRRIEGRGDVETIIGRMYLRLPLDSFSDITAAVGFAEAYAAGLPDRPKKIVLVSSGSGAPSASQPALDSAALEKLINDAKSRLAERNTGLDFARIVPGAPLTNLPSSGRSRPSPARSGTPVQTAAAPPPAPSGAAAPPQSPATPPPPPTPAPAQPAQGQTRPGTAAAAQTPPANRPGAATPTAPPQRPATPPPAAAQPAQSAQGQTRPGAAASGQTRRPADRSGAAAPTAQTPPPGAAQTAPPSTRPGAAGQAAPHSPAVPAQAAQPASAAKTPQTKTARPAAEKKNIPPSLFIGVGALALAALGGLAIYLVSRRLHSSPNRVMAQASAPRSAETVPSPYAGQQPLNLDKDPLLLNLFVEDQSTFIGKRNIHALKSGYSLTIGGGKSDFLIFLVPMPPDIAEIRRNGNRCTFVPRKPKYFPDLGAKELQDCIGKNIRVVSDKNYQLRIRLEQYEDPLAALNRMLNSVKTPG
jgi:hypothetical protein